MNFIKDKNSATKQSQTKKLWRHNTIEDLNEMLEIIKTNHPGPLDKQNPFFNKQLRKNYQKALRKAKQVTSYKGWFYTLKFFKTSFQDVHVDFRPILKEAKKTTLLWPGFIVTKKHNGWFVYYNKQVIKSKEQNIPQKGWELISCDGKTPDQLMEKNIFPYYGIKTLEASLTGLAPHLFLDNANPFVSRLKKCLFDTGKARKKIQLQWTSIPKDKIKTYLKSAQMSGPAYNDFTLSIKEGLVWVTVPTFNFYKPEDSRIKKLEKIINQLAFVRDQKIIVFDVRGHDGGNSVWANKIIEGLWGKEFSNPIIDKLYKSVFVEWRVSDYNISEMRDRLLSIRKTHKKGTSKHIDNLFKILEEMKIAPKNKLYKQLPLTLTDKKPKKQNNLKNPVKGQVFFLTNFSCASACLDFADMILKFPKVIHIGAPTFADTVYMEVAFKKLSSGRAGLIYPKKVWRNRPRGHNQPYIPKYRWQGDWQNETSLRNWIRLLVNKEKITP